MRFAFAHRSGILRNLMRQLSLLALLFGLGLGLLSGCAGDCRRLSEKLCDCSLGTLEKQACKQRVAQEDSRISPTAEDEARCRELLPICDCHTISTPEGKRACGLARYPDAGASLDGGLESSP
jgi:hypothetical protein